MRGSASGSSSRLNVPAVLLGAVQDARYALRQLVRAPGFFAAAVLTLALGVGGTTAIFGAFDAVVLRPLPFQEPERLIDVATAWQGGPGAVSVGNFVVMQQHARAFAGLAARNPATYNLADGGAPERVLGARVSHDYFRVLGVGPALGRVFGADEDQPGHERVVVLSQRLFVRRFGGDPGLVGRTIHLSGIAHDVLGVMPARFQIPGDETELWTPIAFTAEQRVMFDAHYLGVLGRLRPGVTGEQLAEDLQRVAAEMVRAAPKDNEGRALLSAPLLERVVGDSGRRLTLLLTGMALVLLIACVNVANLLLARGATRARELALRAALGAGRARLVRQLLTEAFVLSALGAAAGVALAAVLLRVVVAQGPPDVPRLAEAALDARALAVASAIALLAALVSGLWPALHAAGLDLHDALGRGARGVAGGVGGRLRRALVAAEVALALMLLMGAALLLRSARNLDLVPPGFDATDVLSARLALPSSAYPGDEQPARAFARLVDGLREAPGVAAAAASSRPPLIGEVSYGLLPEGRPPEPRYRINSRLQLVTPGYLELMRVPLRQGRLLEAADRRDGPRVMLVNETLARTAFPGESPIGKRIACCEGDDQNPAWKQIVGVVADTRARGLDKSGFAEFYLPMEQAPARAFDAIGRSVTVLARPRDGAPESLVGALRESVRALDPALPLYDVATMASRLRRSTAPMRFNSILLATLAGVGLLLSAVGLYGVIAYLVSQRTREIGVRIALGALPRHVVALVLKQALGALLAGLGVGMLGCLAQARAFESVVFEVSARDPFTLAAVVALLLAVGLLASALPARRAAALDPTRALAAE